LADERALTEIEIRPDTETDLRDRFLRRLRVISMNIDRTDRDSFTAHVREDELASLDRLIPEFSYIIDDDKELRLLIRRFVVRKD
jgi:hypothetical protein